MVDVLEEHYAEFDGLNLTFECREGILKHCSYGNAVQLGDVGERFIRRLQPGLEAQLANFADEIAYNNHDVDDGIRAGLISVDQLSHPLFAQYHAEVPGNIRLSRAASSLEILRRMINRLVTDLIDTSAARLAAAGVETAAEVRIAILAADRVQRRDREAQSRTQERSARARLQALQGAAHDLEGRRVMTALFEAFLADPRPHARRA